MPSGRPRAMLVTRSGSTTSGSMSSAMLVIAVCMVAPSLLQLLVQQLWNSRPRRITSRELAGVSRSIFDCTAS